MEVIDRIFDSKYQTGIMTGFPSLDTITRGIKGGGLYILAAATGMGKSLLLLNILVNLAKRGKRSLYFDLENGAELTAQRALMIWYGLDNEYFKDKNNKDDAKQKFEEVAKYIDAYDHESIYKVMNESGQDMKTAIRWLIQGSDAEVVAIDPLQAFEEGSTEYNTLQIQTDVTKHFKELAQRINKPIFFCHHVRKSTSTGGTWVEDIDEAVTQKYRMPNIDDLKGSSGITQYATDVWAMVRTAAHKEKEGRGKTYLRILKARRGLQGDTKDLWLDEDTLQYKDRGAQMDVDEIVESFSGGLLG